MMTKPHSADEKKEVLSAGAFSKKTQSSITPEILASTKPPVMVEEEELDDE